MSTTLAKSKSTKNSIKAFKDKEAKKSVVYLVAKSEKSFQEIRTYLAKTKLKKGEQIWKVILQLAPKLEDMRVMPVEFPYSPRVSPEFELPPRRAKCIKYVKQKISSTMHIEVYVAVYVDC